jgi:hypothetical protein
MLKIKIVVVDRTRSAFLKEGESFYLKRLRYYVPVDWVEVKPVRILKGKHEDEMIETEGETIARKISPRDFLVALDRKGDHLDSMAGAIGPACTFRGRVSHRRPFGPVESPSEACSKGPLPVPADSHPRNEPPVAA